MRISIPPSRLLVKVQLKLNCIFLSAAEYISALRLQSAAVSLALYRPLSDVSFCC